MSLHPHVIAPVPDETARVARAAFPKGQLVGQGSVDVVPDVADRTSVVGSGIVRILPDFRSQHPVAAFARARIE